MIYFIYKNKIESMTKKCENCDNSFEIRIVKKGKNKGSIYVEDRNRKFCSIECQHEWQRKIKWEERVGDDIAEKIRHQASERVSGDKNPTHNPSVAEKVSKSLKKYLKNNPRKVNPFYGKKHTEEYKNKSKELKSGIRSYNDEQYQKQKENTPRGEKCHLWNGGCSDNEYPSIFNDKLKRKIKKRDNYICCVCNKKTQKLAVHHIDYIKENCEETNLISLCIGCHGKTNINRNQWKIFFESIIKEKYQTDILTVENTVV